MDRERLKKLTADYVGEQRTAMKAIRHYCVSWCMNNSAKEVELCTTKDCALYPLRFGKSPYLKVKALTEEEKASAAALFKARLNRT